MGERCIDVAVSDRSAAGSFGGGSHVDLMAAINWKHGLTFYMAYQGERRRLPLPALSALTTPRRVLQVTRSLRMCWASGATSTSPFASATV